VSLPSKQRILLRQIVIRKELLEAGIVLEDSSAGTTLRRA